MALQEEFEIQGKWLFKFRGTLPLILLGSGLAYYVWTEKYHHRPFVEDSIYESLYMYACMIISFLGLLLRIYVVGYTPENTSGRNTNEQVADTINKTGMYSMVRHPLYLGNYLMWLGPALLTASIWFVAVFTFIYWLYYERIMFAEEQFLRSKFGNAYIEWASKTPAFIPKFSLFVKPSISFSWKKVLKKEKNGLTALFLVFFSFYSLGEYAKGAVPDNTFLLISCVATLILYFVLKSIKHNTHWLDEKGR
jgi:protein-S-isoprenylcysteine O-methyltransferase Ste14